MISIPTRVLRESFVQFSIASDTNATISMTFQYNNDGKYK